MILKRRLFIGLMVVGMVLNGGIKVSPAVQITPTDGCGEHPAIWDKGSRELIYVKICKDSVEVSWMKAINVETGKVRVLVEKSAGLYDYDYTFLSPDSKYILTNWVSSKIYGFSDFVVVNIETGKIKRYADVRNNRFVHPDSMLFWDLNSGHEVKWMPYKVYDRVVRDSLLREQKHHWPEWMKERWKEERRIQGMYLQAKMKKKKINREEINKIKQIRKEPGHFFTKVLERDDKGYVEKAELWAYPVGREPYLSMDEKTYGGIWGFSPNHKYMIIMGKDNNLYIAHADGSDVTKVTAKPGRYFYIIWSPDSRKVAFDEVVEGGDEANIWLVKIEE